MVDALTFAQGAIDEIKARLSQVNDPISSSFGKSDEEIVEKFFKDQGLTFENLDVKSILELVK